MEGLVGANVRVTVAIDAEVPGGVPEKVVQIVTDDTRTLKFRNHGFEVE